MYSNFRILSCPAYYFSVSSSWVLSISLLSQLPFRPSCSCSLLYSLKGCKSVCTSFQDLNPEVDLAKRSPELHVNEKKQLHYHMQMECIWKLALMVYETSVGQRNYELYIKVTIWMNLTFHEHWRDTFQHQGHLWARSQSLYLSVLKSFISWQPLPSQ